MLAFEEWDKLWLLLHKLCDLRVTRNAVRRWRCWLVDDRRSHRSACAHTCNHDPSGHFCNCTPGTPLRSRQRRPPGDRYNGSSPRRRGH
jgi:hypothetical protein